MRNFGKIAIGVMIAGCSETVAVKNPVVVVPRGENVAVVSGGASSKRTKSAVTNSDTGIRGEILRAGANEDSLIEIQSKIDEIRERVTKDGRSGYDVNGECLGKDYDDWCSGAMSEETAKVLKANPDAYSCAWRGEPGVESPLCLQISDDSEFGKIRRYCSALLLKCIEREF